MKLSQTDLNVITDDQIDSVLFESIVLQPCKADFAILCGTAPEHVDFRIRIAASFFSKGYADKLIVSGAAVSDKSVTESEYMRKGLIALGVPVNAVIEEPRAYDTIQNMTCSLTEICKRCDVFAVKNIAVLTEPFHMRRSLCLAKLLLPKFVNVFPYTEGIDAQRAQWKTDERLNNCVKTEIAILQSLISKGVIEDIDLSE